MNMATPGRPSGIPRTGIPTPGGAGTRPRSTSNAAATAAAPPPDDDEYMSRAFADALKANHPARYNGPRVSDVSASSTSSLAPSSVASSNSRRPSSVATSVSSTSSSAPREKATLPRPASRASDVFTRSVSRAGRTFDVGDNVRIESLGFEGTLRFVGEIDGKQGMWAGVELGPGFAGKGKNNGTVNGKMYFACGPNCGVFVATTKLSAPTVGPGAISRPSSVASNYASGRMTPSLSSSTYGRATPSISNGHITPASSGRVTPSLSSGRVTPGMQRSAPSARLPSVPKTPVTTRAPPSQNTVTPGSRAAKYVGINAQQLTARMSPGKRASLNSPTRSSLSSPTRLLSGPASPQRPSASPVRPIPMLTPKAGARPSLPASAKGRPSIGSTPKARIPSAIEMPPPGSPRAPAGVGDASLKSASQIEMDGRALQDKINWLTSGRATPASPSIKPTLARSQSSWTVSDDEHQEELARLQSRLAALEYENSLLRTSQAETPATLAEPAGAVAQTPAPASGEHLEEALAASEALRAERDTAQSRIAELEAALRAAERNVDERDVKIESLEHSTQSSTDALSKLRNEQEARLAALQEELADSEVLLHSLKEAAEEKESAAREAVEALQAKNGELATLETKLQQAQSEFATEKRDLDTEVNELRQAGQETIALYEERLSETDGKRYELEDRLAALQEELRARARPQSPASAARQAVSAAEIDNESLREQVQHLQKRIAILEDANEDSRAVAEREESAAQERIARAKEEKEVLRKEVTTAQAEIDALTKAEARAKDRLAETEDAVREGAVALEDARAEIEGLRAELANLQGLVASGEEGLADRSTASVGDGASAALKAELAEAKASCSELQQRLTEVQLELEQTSHALRSIKEVVSVADTEKSQLEEANKDLQTKYDQETQKIGTIQEQLDERLRELEELKQAQPTSPVALSPSPSSKRDLHATKEELTGLKVIVQELHQDNHSANQRIKTLEAENTLLQTEMEKLREEITALEESLEQTILREEATLAVDESKAASTSTPAPPLAPSDAAANGKVDAELEQLRKKFSEMEMKHARTVHDLNKEITELESLVETKIYHEDELERELDSLRHAQRRAATKADRKRSKGSSELGAVPEDRPTSPTLTPSGGGSGPLPETSGHARSASLLGGDGELCEICEQPGHDIFACDMLQGSSSPTLMMARINGGGGDADLSVSGSPAPTAKSAVDAPVTLHCVDCDSDGHVADDCPYAQDVF